MLKMGNLSWDFELIQANGFKSVPCDCDRLFGGDRVEGDLLPFDSLHGTSLAFMRSHLHLHHDVSIGHDIIIVYISSDVAGFGERFFPDTGERWEYIH